MALTDDTRLIIVTCPGIEIESGSYSGCNASRGSDCPVCEGTSIIQYCPRCAARFTNGPCPNCGWSVEEIVYP